MGEPEKAGEGRNLAATHVCFSVWILRLHSAAGKFHLLYHFSPLPIIDTGSVKQKLFFLAVLEANTQLKHRCVCLTGIFAMEILRYYPGRVT